MQNRGSDRTRSGFLINEIRLKEIPAGKRWGEGVLKGDIVRDEWGCILGSKQGSLRVRGGLGHTTVISSSVPDASLGV